MQVKLRVIGGKNDGREIKISVPEFVIGRGEGTHLRPQSDLISRRHCALVVGDGKAILRDFGSRNGSYVNGERVEGEQVLRAGDMMRVGRLQFEIQIDHSAAGTKKPKVEGVKEAAIRTAESGGKANVDDDNITDWLMEADEPKTPVRRTAAETRQFVLDETEQIEIESDSEESVSGEQDSKESRSKSGTKEKGKLPFKPKINSVDSKDAATQVLRKFFNRR